MVFEPGSVIQMKYSNVFVIAVLVSVFAAGFVCIADDAEATPSNSGEAFVEDINTLLKGSIGDDIAQATYSEGVVEIFVDPSYASLVPLVDTAELKAKALQTFLTYDSFYLDGVYYVKDGTPYVDEGVEAGLRIAGQIQQTLCVSEPGLITVFESESFQIAKEGYDIFDGRIVLKVLADQDDLSFAKTVSDYAYIDPATGHAYLEVVLYGIDRDLTIAETLKVYSQNTADRFFGAEHAGKINMICQKLLEYPGIVNSASIIWNDDGVSYGVAIADFQPGEGADAFQKLANGLYNSRAYVEGFVDGWDIPVKTFQDPVTGNYVVDDGVAAAGYHADASHVITITADFDATIVPGYYNSGMAFVDDMNRFFERLFQSDIVAFGTYSDENLAFHFDYSSVYDRSLDIEIDDTLEEMAATILNSYSLFSIDGTEFVVDGMPQTSSVHKLLYIMADMANAVRNASPGVVKIYESDDLSVKHMLWPQYNGGVYLTTDLDQFTIDAANYIAKFISVDPETLTISVKAYVYGLDDEYNAEDLAFIYSHVTAKQVFDDRFVDYINWGCENLMDEGAPYATYFSIIWEDNAGNAYKLALNEFTPGEGKDAFQKLVAGIYNNMNKNPAGFKNGWDVPVKAFEIAENRYVAEGYGVMSVPGYSSFSVPVIADLTTLDRPYDINVEDPEHATIIIVPNIHPTKVPVVVIPDDGYEVEKVIVVIDGKEYDITETGYFELTGDATVTAEVKPTGYVPVTGVNIYVDTITMTVGESNIVPYTVLPSDATNKAVTWSTSNSSVATVSNGIVTGVAPGTATITVTTVDGGYTDTCTVTIKAAFIPVTGVTLNVDSLSLTLGVEAVLTATVTPYNATNKAVTWTSSDSTVATVSNGVVKPLKVGTTIITVTTVDGGYTDTCTVTVKPYEPPVIPVTGVALSADSLTLTVGDEATLTAIVAPTNATNKTVYWSTSDASIATVSSGVVKALKAGTATITVRTADGNFTDTCTVTVKAAAIPVTGVTLDQTSKTIELGEEFTLTATVLPYNATNKTVYWSTSDASIATVDNGIVRGVGAGTATITVRTADGGFTATCEVTVSGDIKVTGVTVGPSTATVAIGKTITLVASIIPYNATNQNVSWSSSDSSIASVDKNGVVTGIKVGTAVITVTTEDGGYTATSTVTVEKSPVVPVTGVKLDKTTASINVGETVTLTATVLPSDATNKNITWSTSNSKVATVSNGVVKAVAAGNATITVTTEDGSHTATCELTVTEKPSSGGDNTLLYVGIAAAIILVILAAFLLMRRRS